MEREDEATRQARIELAAALRWAARQGFQSGVCNHFSVAVPGRPDLMLINPEGYFWAEARASDMVVAAHDGTLHGANGHTVETTAFCIHAPIHRLLRAHPQSPSTMNCSRSPSHCGQRQWAGRPVKGVPGGTCHWASPSAGS